MAIASADGRQVIRTFVEHEHEELATAIDGIHELGESLTTMPVDQRSGGIRKVLHWIDSDLKPHMAWEESWLFPQVDCRAGTPWATRLVRFEHRQIATVADRLDGHCAPGTRLPSSETSTIVADLAALEALLRAHIEREERFLLPVLESEADCWVPEWRD